jgi:lipopolysaccharide transport system ATP-binding protein
MFRLECHSVSKRFRRQQGPRLLRAHVADLFKPKRDEWFYALRNVSFEVRAGESVAVIGPNGAGKSTLLSLLTGLANPDSGSLSVNGRVAALLELGSGFHADLTGVENVRLNAALLGFTRRETDRLFDQLVEFAGIGEFINEPLRTYSSGMIMRLAFSVAVNLNPDILLIDEVIAVGDQDFQIKCFNKIRHFREAGKTIVAVSHAAAMLLDLCDTAVWLDHGEVVMRGEIKPVLDAYAGQFVARTPGASE